MSKRAYTVLPPDREEKVLGIFVRDASFYRTFFPLLLVIVLQQLAALADGGNDGAERFLQALAQGMERGDDE